MTPGQFYAWIDRAHRGAEIVYHVGLLMRDRQQYGREALHVLATAVYHAYAAKRVVLFQRRVAPGEYEYCAVRR